ncbi:MAG TPA: DUF3263 domain-containing protein [Actinokineospora sp.]|jgi:hypothetical protein|nr:DUF3263 domain-containing protein [Actinokineospora sp.]
MNAAEVPELPEPQPSRPKHSGGLSDRDHAMLAFEKQWWKAAGSKEQAIREIFDLSSTRYYQILNELIEKPEALAVEPMLVKRLRRMRGTRLTARSRSRLGMEQR